LSELASISGVGTSVHVENGRVEKAATASAAARPVRERSSKGTVRQKKSSRGRNVSLRSALVFCGKPQELKMNQNNQNNPNPKQGGQQDQQGGQGGQQQGGQQQKPGQQSQTNPGQKGGQQGGQGGQQNQDR
jgi:hypothetical protein